MIFLFLKIIGAWLFLAVAWMFGYTFYINKKGYLGSLEMEGIIALMGFMWPIFVSLMVYFYIYKFVQKFKKGENNGK